ncbi:MAG: hypothetical protein ACYTGZ_10295 [Planctomycetota bacterium]|jgi:hypothetical protein
MRITNSATLFVVSITLGFTVGCATPDAKEDWSDSVPGGTNSYFNVSQVTVKSGGETGIEDLVYGVGYKMENSRNKFRAEVYGGQPDGSDWYGGVFEGAAKITPWRLGSRDEKGSGLVFTPYAGGGIRGNYVKDVEKVTWGTGYGHVGVGFDWFLGANTRLFLDGRAGLGVNFGSTSLDDEEVATDPILVYRVEAGIDYKRLQLMVFYDFSELQIDTKSTGDSEDSDISFAGVQIGYNW